MTCATNAAVSARLEVTLCAVLIACAACKDKPAPPTAGPAATAPRDGGLQPVPRSADGGVDRASLAAAFDGKCVAGELEACRNLAIMYSEGAGVPADPVRAAALFAQACNGGHVASCNHLALAYEKGDGVAQDRSQAIAAYERACTGNYPLACRNLGLLLRTSDEPRAATLLDRACGAKVPFACTNAGTLDAEIAVRLSRGGGAAPELAARKKLMVGHFKAGCDAGEASACRQLAILYYDGFGLPRSAPAAAVWFKKACDGDDAVACRALGGLLRAGDGVPRDEPRARALFDKACARKDTQACDLARATPAAP